ncbi:hypothetical protein RZ760_009215 [Providencia rettgeri]|nr:hypothetical protein [Providencia rettgeri]
MAFIIGSTETAIVTVSGIFIAPIITTLSVLFSSICRVGDSKNNIYLKDYRWLCLILFIVLVPLIWFTSWYILEGEYSYSNSVINYVRIVCFSILWFSLFNINRYYSILKVGNIQNTSKTWFAILMNCILTMIFYFLFGFLNVNPVYSIALSTVITSFFLFYITYQKEYIKVKNSISIYSMFIIIKNGWGIAIFVLFEITMFSIAPIFLTRYGIERLVLHQYFYVISTIAMIFSYGVSVNAIYFVSSQLTTGVEYLTIIASIIKSKFYYLLFFLLSITIVSIFNSSGVSIFEFLLIILLFCTLDSIQVILSGVLRGYGKDKYVSFTYFIVYSTTISLMFFDCVIGFFDNKAANLWSVFCLSMAINAIMFSSYIIILRNKSIPLKKGITQCSRRLFQILKKNLTWIKNGYIWD